TIGIFFDRSNNTSVAENLFLNLNKHIYEYYSRDNKIFFNDFGNGYSPLTIDDSGGGDITWSQVKNWNIFSGTGTSEEPYLIKGIIFNGQNSSSSLEIRNSDVYFIIENCTFLNSSKGEFPIRHAGIKFTNVNNSRIYNNTICRNQGDGIRLEKSNDNLISDNYIYNNTDGINIDLSNRNNLTNNFIFENGYIYDGWKVGSGIYLTGNKNLLCNNTIERNIGSGIVIQGESMNNTISFNSLSQDGISVSVRTGNDIFEFNKIFRNIITNSTYGIWLGLTEYGLGRGSLKYNNISSNKMLECGFELINNIEDGLEDLVTNSIDKLNTVDGKPLYVYLNISNLGYENFTNAGQIILYNCNNTMIRDAMISHCYYGIFLRESNHIFISNVNCSENHYGIRFENCENITIFNSNSSYNSIGFSDYESYNITFISNVAYYNEEGGIQIMGNTYDINLTKNKMSNCGISLEIWDLGFARTISLDTSNTVNGNPVYYYIDRKMLSKNDFTIYGNAGQVILYNCSDSVISDLNLSRASIGLKFYSCSNNIIRNLNCSYNNIVGIYLNGENNTLVDNYISHNKGDSWYSGGICVMGENNNISNNLILSNDESGIGLWFQNNYVYNNTIIGNIENGILIEDSENVILKNIIQDNNEYGIKLKHNYNNITSNQVKNSNIGIFIQPFSYYNLICKNNLSYNEVNAIDEGSDNEWDNETIGNYWSDYLGRDADDNGIGDYPYNISLNPLIQDRFPIFEDQDETAPLITEKLIQDFDIYNSTAPLFELEIEEKNIETTWYRFWNGTLLTNNFTFEYADNFPLRIDQHEWERVGNGSIVISFYVNDTAGNWAWYNVTVYKDIVAPSILIITPENSMLLNGTAPTFDLSIRASDLNTTWYQLYNGSVLTVPQRFTYGVDSQILQTRWEEVGNGSVIISFYANDTVGNIVCYNTSVYKDIVAPYIIINSPQSNIFFNEIPPTFDLSITASDLNTTWYQLYNSSVLTDPQQFTYGVDSQILQTHWEEVGNGSVIISFYANDTVGNIVCYNTSVYKDIIAPSIQIINLKNNMLLNGTAPGFDLIVEEINLDSTWYQLYNGSVLTYPQQFTYGVENQILQSHWNEMGNGSVIVSFHANDSAGNLALYNLSVNKDIAAPSIYIVAPFNDVRFPTVPPEFNLTIVEGNLNKTWYTLNNGEMKYFFIEFNGTINQTAWEDLPDGTVIITFYANDSLGNEYSKDVSVIKGQEIAPDQPPISDDGGNGGGSSSDSQSDNAEAITITVIIIVIGSGIGVSVVIIIIIRKSKT
ncbi:MAG: hypothetical protein GF383_14830, partial [Candidatus Lokiarchaeota archaeon]|nr:hypothetical protein [Candidatus Lokiarchaeota archaeon]MBD3342691.1 hypothetical protein [Candidatus Lokiarchaeota archaeon]